MVIRMGHVKGLLTCLVKFYFLTWKEVVIEVYLIIIHQIMHFLQVLCVWHARTCMCIFSGFAFVCGAEDKVSRDHLSIHSRLLSANTRQLLKSGGLMSWCNALRFMSLH